MDIAYFYSVAILFLLSIFMIYIDPNIILIAKIILLLCVASIIFIIFRRYKRKNHLELPKKIYFKPESNNDYGVGSFLLDITTLGGHGRLKEAIYNYEQSYLKYTVDFNESVDLRRDFYDQLNCLGTLTSEITKELEKSQKILGREKASNTDVSLKIQNTSTNIQAIQSTTYSVANTGSIILGGATIGGLAAVGSWTIVSLVGTASTGTAIVSLSGIAAQNAILAWFGGGALAAGGGGMAAGVLTLGAIVALPLVVFSSYKTHKNASELENSIQDVLEQNFKIESFNRDINELINLSKIQENILKDRLEKIKKINKDLYGVIYPNGKFSYIKRNINEFFNKEYYSKVEADELDKITSAIDDIYEIFNIEELAEIKVEQQIQREVTQLSLTNNEIDDLAIHDTAHEIGKQDFLQGTFTSPESRNTQCPCNSGLKYKQCHGKI